MQPASRHFFPSTRRRGAGPSAAPLRKRDSPIPSGAVRSSPGALAEPRARILLAGAGLVLATLIAYLPALRGGWVWDDNAYVTDNPLLVDPKGLQKIWFSLESPSQYFPLTYTSFRLERSLWGLEPFGYHLTNVLLHAANALLVWILLARIPLPGAFLAAAIFALHPVQVESVAWVAERKNVLSGLFFLLTLGAFLRALGAGARQASRWLGISLFCHALALFSKTTAAVMPAVLLLLVWWREGRVAARRWLQVAPFAALGLGLGLVSVWWERVHQGTWGPEFAFTAAERLLIAGRALPFYLGKLILPAGLSFSYPRWEIDPGDPWSYLWPTAVIAALAALWLGRRRLGRGLFAGALFFVVCLLPLIGPFSLYTFRYSFVADHYQYLACLGPIALFAAALGRTWKRLPRARTACAAAGGVLLLACGALTWQRAGVYRDDLTLWSDTLAKNPSSWFVLNNYADALHQRGDAAGALGPAREALRLKPDDPFVLTNYGSILQSAGRFEEAAGYYREALRILPGYPRAQAKLGSVLSLDGATEEAQELIRDALRDPGLRARAHLRMGDVHAMAGRLPEAAAAYRLALELRPDLDEARAKLQALESRRISQ